MPFDLSGLTTWLLPAAVGCNIALSVLFFVGHWRLQAARAHVKDEQKKVELIHWFLVNKLGPQLGVDIELRMEQDDAKTQFEAILRSTEQGAAFGLPPSTQKR